MRPRQHTCGWFACGSGSWLIPRLPDLQRAHPDVQLELRIGRSANELKRGHAAIAILAGSRPELAMPTTLLARLTTILVSAPRLADGRDCQRTLGDLAAHRRLAVYKPEGVWDRWLRATGYDGAELSPPVYFEAHFLMIESAAAGLGVALTPPILAQRFLYDGRLVVLPFRGRCRGRIQYGIRRRTTLLQTRCREVFRIGSDGR